MPVQNLAATVIIWGTRWSIINTPVYTLNLRWSGLSALNRASHCWHSDSCLRLRAGVVIESYCDAVKMAGGGKSVRAAKMACSSENADERIFKSVKMVHPGNAGINAGKFLAAMSD